MMNRVGRDIGGMRLSRERLGLVLLLGGPRYIHGAF